MPSHDRRLELREAVRHDVPDRPGVYVWLSARGERLYIGKSRRLRQRMLSYLMPAQTDAGSRHRHLASSIEAFEFTETRGELLALLLEDALIKADSPRHNERQKDYRERRYVLLTDDLFPTCIVADADVGRAGALFGPFKDEYFAKDLIALVAATFRVRACHDREPFRRSARFDLGACLGPCRGAVSEAEYGEMAAKVRDFLEGDERWVVASLGSAIAAASEGMRFEEAAAMYQKLEFCRRFCARQRFFREFEAGEMYAAEPRLGLRYRFVRGLLAEVLCAAGDRADVPPELRSPIDDRRMLLDRANVVYAWKQAERRSRAT